MGALMTWLLPVAALLVIVFEAWRLRRRRPGVGALVSAVVSAGVVLLVCRGNIAWNEVMPVAVWWVIAALAAGLVGWAAARMVGARGSDREAWRAAAASSTTGRTERR